MRRLLVWSLLLASPVVAQQTPTYSLLIPPNALFPRMSGAGFGSALSSPLRYVAEGNPGALPATRGGALGMWRDVPHTTSPPGITDGDGIPVEVETQRRMAASPLPSSAGVVWKGNIFRIGLGYTRSLDYQGDLSGQQITARFASTLHQAAASLAGAWTVPGVGVLMPGVRVSRVVYNEQNRWINDVTTQTEARVSGLGWAVGAVVEPHALPLRVGMFYEGRTPLEGFLRAQCDIPREALCYPPTGRYDASADRPARFEASAGGQVAGFSWDVTAARVFWGDLNVSEEGIYTSTWEGHANVRYSLQPGLSASLGVSQSDRAPYKDDMVVSLYGDDTMRLLLLGATYERGPLVLDAAYVNGSILPNDGSKTHLATLGVGYRF